MEEYQVQIKQELEDIETTEGWNFQFQKIRMESSNNDLTCSEAKSPSNRLLNRYRDVSPFDHSRVILTKGPTSYINANYVKVEQAGRNYILTQGPLPQTTGHFWLMVWEQRSKAVLMLNKVIEKGQVKCHQYWPVELGEEHCFQDVGLKLTLIGEENCQHFIIRTLRLEDTTTGNTREVIQFHYITWPDFGIPSTPGAFLHFLQSVRDSGALSQNVGPPIVHCSAGIGRSGTFCLVDSCLLMMEEGKPVSVRNILLDMRRYRMGLIQTADQLKFAYLAIIEGITQLVEGHKRFLPEESMVGLEENERPLPPRRIESLSQGGGVADDYRRIIEEHRFLSTRPLPETPNASSSDELSETDEDDSITESDKLEDISRKMEIPTNGSAVHENHVNESAQENHCSPQENHVDDDMVLRRRVKNEVLREKIRDIKAHQKESEEMQKIYMKFPKKYLFAILMVGVGAFYYYRSSSS